MLERGCGNLRHIALTIYGRVAKVGASQKEGASMSKFKQLHDRVLQDPSFRARLTNQTEDTLRSVGIEPTPGLVGDVKTALRQFQELEKLGQKIGGDVVEDIELDAAAMKQCVT